MGVVIRPWRPNDQNFLVPMIREFLKIGESRGASLAATQRNAETFFDIGIDGARVGDPCLVADDTNEIISYIEWTSPPGVDRFDSTRRTCHTFGAFTLARWRSHGIANELRQQAKRMCIERGYEAVTGPVHMTNERGMRYFMEEGAWPMSVQFEYLL